MRLSLFIFLCVGSILRLTAQTTPVDSLTKVLEKNNLSDSATIAVMIELSYAYTQIVPDSTFSIGTRALELAREKEFRILEAWALNRISGYYWIAAKFPSAIETAQESLKIFEEEGDVRGIADSYNVLGNTNAMDNDLERALEYYSKSLEKFTEIGDADAVSRGLSNVGRVNYMLGRYDTALYFMEQIKEHVLGTNSIRESIMYNTTGDIYQKLGRAMEALDCYVKGLAIAENLNSSRIITYSTRGMAEVYQILGDIPSSNRYALKTYNISQEIGYLENVRNASKILSDNYELIGDYENAYKFFVKFTATKDTMFNISKSRELQKLEESFEINQKQKEIELLTAEKELQDQRSNQQRIIMFALTIIVALGGVLAFVQYRQSSLKQRSFQLLSEQKRMLELKNKDIEEQRAEIQKQAILLEEANRSKDKLFSIISHDLKSPFGALLMITEQLDQQTFSQEELSMLKNALQGRVKSLNELLNNLLMWSKSQLQGVSIEMKTFDLNTIISQNIEVFKQVAEAKGIRLIAQFDGECEVFADVNQINCVIRNLINNAVKFTDVDGTINVAVTQNPNEIKVIVEDSGIGMSEEVMAGIFTSSSKMRMKGTGNEEGTGLGLFLCKEFVEKNGGTIAVESELKKGSKFYFTIPVRS